MVEDMKRLRLMVQVAFSIITNGYAYGFLQGKIYRGGLKYACVPGLNCYSCPGATAACPIGALQALLNQRGLTVPFWALGFLFLFGSLLGRFVCGWLCPFGLVQDLLHKIPLFRKRKRLPFHRVLKYGKYAVLILLVGVGSAFLFSGFAKVPAFCKYLCPSGTLLGACRCWVPMRPCGARPAGCFLEGRRAAGGGDAVHQGIPSFCQYLCPLGAIYGWFNRFSLVQIHWETEQCVHCGACQAACPVDLSVEEISKSPECIRCGKCAAACPRDCLHFFQAKREAPDSDC